MSDVAYDPSRSTVSADRLATFIAAPISGDITEVPGIGPAAAKALGEQGVTSTYALIGKYLTLKGADVGPVQHCDMFWYWLRDAGVNSHRSGIVQAVAEKMDMMMPGIYDKAVYDEK